MKYLISKLPSSGNVNYSSVVVSLHLCCCWGSLKYLKQGELSKLQIYQSKISKCNFDLLNLKKKTIFFVCFKFWIYFLGHAIKNIWIFSSNLIIYFRNKKIIKKVIWPHFYHGINCLLHNVSCIYFTAIQSHIESINKSQ